MNETIKQLCEQSKVYANESTKDFTGNEPVVWMDYYTEKFAELIVSDAIDKIESVGFKSSNDIPFAITDLFVSQIKQHFGVK